MVDVYVPGDAPAHHLEVVDADTMLQQVVPLFIVDQQNVLTDNKLIVEQGTFNLICVTFEVLVL